MSASPNYKLDEFIKKFALDDDTNTMNNTTTSSRSSSRSKYSSSNKSKNNAINNSDVNNSSIINNGNSSGSSNSNGIGSNITNGSIVKVKGINVYNKGNTSIVDNDDNDDDNDDDDIQTVVQEALKRIDNLSNNRRSIKTTSNGNTPIDERGRSPAPPSPSSSKTNNIRRPSYSDNRNLNNTVSLSPTNRSSKADTSGFNRQSFSSSSSPFDREREQILKSPLTEHYKKLLNKLNQQAEKIVATQWYYYY